jgi:hypothetical protein
VYGIITRLNNVLEKYVMCRQPLVAEHGEFHRRVENAKVEVIKPFSDKAILEAKVQEAG